MSARTNHLHAADRRASRQVLDIGDELREARLALGLSQAAIAVATHMSRNHYRGLEEGTLLSATVRELNRVAAVLGLDVSLRVYPVGRPLRDAAHTDRLSAFLGMAQPPLTVRTEVPVRQRQDRFDQRAWDATLHGHGAWTAIELEMRIRDAQAVRRRHELKRRDDPPDHFLLLLADTRHNRRVLAEYPELFGDLPRLRPGVVRTALQAGRHPGTGLLLIGAARPQREGSYEPVARAAA